MVNHVPDFTWIDAGNSEPRCFADSGLVFERPGRGFVVKAARSHDSLWLDFVEAILCQLLGWPRGLELPTVPPSLLCLKAAFERHDAASPSELHAHAMAQPFRIAVPTYVLCIRVFDYIVTNITCS